MKNFKKLKTGFTAFLSVCFISMIITVLRQFYFQKQGEIVLNQLKNTLENTENKVESSSDEAIFQEGSIGILRIPSIKIEAPIYEGTEQSILKYAIRTF